MTTDELGGIPDVEGEESILFFYDGEVKGYRARLPSGGTPLIRPINPRVLLRLIQHFKGKEPVPPKTEVPVPGTGLAQEFTDEDDATYKRAHVAWTQTFIDALLLRCIWDGLVVPEDDAWAAKLERLGMPVPSEGPDRAEVYAEEVYPQLLGRGDPKDQGAFVEALRQLTIPTDAVVQAMRRKFRNALARDGSDGPTPSDGGVRVGSPNGGAEGASAVSNTGDGEAHNDAGGEGPPDSSSP